MSATEAVREALLEEELDLASGMVRAQQEEEAQRIEIPPVGFARKYVAGIKRYRYYVMLFWLAMVLACAYSASQLINVVVMKYDPPKGSLGDIADRTFKQEFPGMSHETDTIVLVTSNNGEPVIQPEVGQFMHELNASITDWGLETTNPPTYFRVLHYFLLENLGANTTARSLASNSSDPDASTATFATITITEAGFRQGSQEGSKFVEWLDDKIHDLNEKIIGDPDVEVYATGFLCFANDMQKGSEHDMIVMDGLTLPFALTVLAAMLRSFRLLIIPLVNILCTLIVSFAFMYPVAVSVDVIAVCPSVICSCVLAFSIDYSLFLLTRYREEIIKGTEMAEAIAIMVESAGHTIMVSGATIALCWFGLMIFPVMLLSTVGLGAGISVLITFAVNITLTPSLLITFHSFFSHFDNCGCPGHCFNNCDTTHRNSLQNDNREPLLQSDGDYSELQGAGVPPLSPSSYDAWGRTSVTSPAALAAMNTSSNEVGLMGRRNSLLSPRLRATDGSEVNDPRFGAIDPSIEVNFLRKNSVWFRSGERCFGTPGRAIIATLIVIVPIFLLAPQALSFHHSESFTLFTPRSSDATKAAQIMERKFGGGRIAPYSLLVHGNESTNVLSDEFFTHMQHVIENVLLKVEEPNVVGYDSPEPVLQPTGVNGMMYLRGIPVAFHSSKEHKLSVIGCAAQVATTVVEKAVYSVCVKNRCKERVEECHADKDCASSMTCVNQCTSLPLKSQPKCIASCHPLRLFSLVTCGIEQCLFHRKPEVTTELTTTSVRHSMTPDRIGRNSVEIVHALETSLANVEANQSNLGLNARLFDIVSQGTIEPDCTSVLLQVLQQAKISTRPSFALSKYTWLSLELNIDPFSSRGSAWLGRVRESLARQGEKDGYDYMLAGGDTAGHDTVNKVFDMFPIVAASVTSVVLVLVGIAFKTVIVPIRALFTIATTLCLVYGAGVGTYEHNALGWTSFTGVMNPLNQLSWLVPAMACFLVFGLALDYDIFLLVRIVEYRESGFNDRDSILCGLAQTGSVITGAGVIMTLAFAGLLFSDIPALNQLSFFLVIAVVSDTFVVRTIVVPAMMMLLGRFNWFPRQPKIVEY